MDAGDDECRGATRGHVRHAHADALRGSLAGAGDPPDSMMRVAGGRFTTEVLTSARVWSAIVGFDGVGGDGLAHEGPSVASSPMWARGMCVPRLVTIS